MSDDFHMLKHFDTDHQSESQVTIAYILHFEIASRGKNRTA